MIGPNEQPAINNEESVVENPASSENQESLDDCEIVDARNFITKLIETQKNEPEVFQELVSNPDLNPWIHEALSNIPTLDLFHLCGDNQEFQNFLIQNIFSEKETELYRDDTVRAIPEPDSSDKLMSMVGSVDGGNILTGELNTKGDPVRTKKDKHPKTAERAEIIGAHADFLDGRDDSIDVLMAEVADGVYNLTQLLILDPNPENQERYQQFIDQIAAIYNVSVADMLALVTIKYHFRMYSSKNGKNKYDEEDKLIKVALKERFPEFMINPQDEKEKKSYSATELVEILSSYIEANQETINTEEYTQEQLAELMSKAIKAHEAEGAEPYPSPELIEMISKSIRAYDKLFVDLRIMLQNTFYGEFSNLDQETQDRLAQRAAQDLKKVVQIMEVINSGEYPNLIVELIRIIASLDIPGVTIEINEEVLAKYLAEIATEQLENYEEDVADQPANSTEPTN